MLRSLVDWLGGTSGLVIHGLLIVFLGVYVPWRTGIDLLDPLLVIPYWCTSLLFVAGAAPEAFAGVVPGSSDVRAKLFAVVAGGFVYGLLITGLAWLIVNTTHWHGELLAPAGAVRWTAPLLSLAASVCMTAIGARLSMQEGYTVQSVKSALRGVLWGLGLLLVVGPSLAPAGVREWIAPHLTTSGLASLSLLASVVLVLVAAWQLRA